MASATKAQSGGGTASSFTPIITLTTISNQDDLSAMTVSLNTVTIGGVTKTPSAVAFRVNGATTGLADPTAVGGTTFTPTRGGEYTIGGTVTIDGVTYAITPQTVTVGVLRLGWYFVEVFRLSRYTGSSIDLKAAGTGTQTLTGAGGAGDDVDVEVTGAGLASTTSCTLSSSGFTLTASGSGGNIEVPYTNAYSSWTDEPIWFEIIAAGDYSTSGNQASVYHSDADYSDREGARRRNTTGTVSVDGVKRVGGGGEVNETLVTPQNSTCVLGALLLSGGETRKYSDTGTSFPTSPTEVGTSGRSRADSGSDWGWTPEKVVINLNDAGGDTLTVTDMRMLVAL